MKPNKELHGWYSSTQFKSINRMCDRGFKSINRIFDRGQKYLYYVNEEDQIVEVTMVSESIYHGCSFNDMNYLGKLKKFHKIVHK